MSTSEILEDLFTNLQNLSIPELEEIASTQGLGVYRRGMSRRLYKSYLVGMVRKKYIGNSNRDSHKKPNGLRVNSTIKNSRDLNNISAVVSMGGM